MLQSLRKKNDKHMLGKQILRTADGTEIQYSLKKKKKKKKKQERKKITKKLKKKRGVGGGGGGWTQKGLHWKYSILKKRWILEKQITTKNKQKKTKKTKIK